MTFIWIVALLFVTSAQGKIRLCPNDGQPKANPDGSLVQCLPGQDNLEVCGAGHSCYFSGYNYQCCPSPDDPVESFHGECPSNSVAVLDSAGYPIKCSTLGNYCPKSNMFCHDDAASPFCCERVARKPATHTEAPKTSPIPKEAEEFFKDDEEQQLVQVDHSSNQVDCPAKTFELLGEDGDVVRCENYTCPSGKCIQKSICCVESNTPASQSDKTTTTEATTTTQSTTVKAETSTTTEAPKPVRIHAVKNIPKEALEYKSHSAGGYVAGNPLAQPPRDQEQPKKQYVQHYLLEQIKRGWPYDDKFYRPENMDVIRKGRNPTAIVNFN